MNRGHWSPQDRPETKLDTRQGELEVLGRWIAPDEGGKFWLSIMNNLKNRDLEDILMAVVDGLKGFPDAINAAFPETTVHNSPDQQRTEALERVVIRSRFVRAKGFVYKPANTM